MLLLDSSRIIGQAYLIGCTYGWMFFCTIAGVGDKTVEVSNAMTVRRWDTEWGFGELYKEVTPGTQLDPIPDMSSENGERPPKLEIYKEQILFAYPVSSTDWVPALEAARYNRVRDKKYIRGPEEWNITVTTYGWIYIAQTVYRGDDHLELRPAATLRRWGTTWALGELLEGPTPNTQVDPIPLGPGVDELPGRSVLISERHTIFSVPCCGKGWKAAIERELSRRGVPPLDA